jgi:hypothetical protein
MTSSVLYLTSHSNFDLRLNQTLSFPLTSPSCTLLLLFSNNFSEVIDTIHRSSFGFTDTSTFITILDPEEPDDVITSFETVLVNKRFHYISKMIIVGDGGWALVCYFCEGRSRLKWSRFPVPKLSEIQTSERTASTLILSSTTTREPEDALDPRCTAEAYSRRPPNCHTSHPMLRILAHRLNMTFSLTHLEDHTRFDSPGLHVCILCTARTKLFYPINTKVFFYDRSRLQFTYCYRSQAFKESELVPFEKFPCEQVPRKSYLERVSWKERVPWKRFPGNTSLQEKYS